MKSEMAELMEKGMIAFGKPYVLIMSANRRDDAVYNIVIESTSDSWMFGHVALSRTLELCEIPGIKAMQMRIVQSPQQQPGVNVAWRRDIVMRSPDQQLRARLSEIALIEDCWKKLVPYDAFDERGFVVNEAAVLSAFPELKAYNVASGVFAQPPPMIVSQGKIINPNVESEQSSEDR